MRARITALEPLDKLLIPVGGGGLISGVFFLKRMENC